MARLARDHLVRHWESDNLGLADGKAVVLPGLKRWLQEHGWGQFSDSRLAETLTSGELPSEPHEVASDLVKCAGLAHERP